MMIGTVGFVQFNMDDELPEAEAEIISLEANKTVMSIVTPTYRGKVVTRNLAATRRILNY